MVINVAKVYFWLFIDANYCLMWVRKINAQYFHFQVDIYNVKQNVRFIDLIYLIDSTLNVYCVIKIWWICFYTVRFWPFLQECVFNYYDTIYDSICCILWQLFERLFKYFIIIIIVVVITILLYLLVNEWQKTFKNIFSNGL